VAENSWTRSILLTIVKNQTLERAGRAPSNYVDRLVARVDGPLRPATARDGRALSEPPVEVARRDALAYWGIQTFPTVKVRVTVNTGEYQAGEWTAHEAPTTHFVEAKF
jgi:hypothetical protein